MLFMLTHHGTVIIPPITSVLVLVLYFGELKRFASFGVINHDEVDVFSGALYRTNILTYVVSIHDWQSKSKPSSSIYSHT